MSGGKERPKRRLKIKSEVPLKPSRKWRNEEMKTLYECIMENGHKDLNRIQERLPGRTLDNIKTFMRTVYDSAGKVSEGHANIDAWINLCPVDLSSECGRDSLQISQILKYLSVNGLLENHPLPETCDGIDFAMAYRFIYQAIMGYPIQPVNQATLDFIHQTIGELNREIKDDKSVIESVRSFLSKKQGSDELSVPLNIKSETSEIEKEKRTENVKKLKVYQRKKPPPTSDTKVPSLKIVVEEASTDQSGSVKDFSVRIEGEQSSAVNVPVPVVAQQKVDENEQQLLKSKSFNPFEIPEKWLEEPLYRNLLLKPTP